MFSLALLFITGSIVMIIIISKDAFFWNVLAVYNITLYYIVFYASVYVCVYKCMCVCICVCVCV